jgi:hypothetical protein
MVQLLGSPEHHPRSLRGRWLFLRGVLVIFDIMDVPNIHQGSYVSISDLYLPGKWSNSWGRGKDKQNVIQGKFNIHL